MRHLSKYKLLSFLLFLIFASSMHLAQTKEGTVRIESSAHIDEMVAQKKDYNKTVETLPGYKIQIYYGSEKECYEVKDEFLPILRKYLHQSFSARPNGNFR